MKTTKPTKTTRKMVHPIRMAFVVDLSVLYKHTANIYLSIVGSFKNVFKNKVSVYCCWDWDTHFPRVVFIITYPEILHTLWHYINYFYSS